KAFALIGKAGIDRAQYLDILTNTLFGAPVYKTYGKLIAEEHYTPAGFKAELGYKDVGLALSAARELKAPMPLASFISDRFLALIASRAAISTGRRWRFLPSEMPAGGGRYVSPNESRGSQGFFFRSRDLG